jgi:GNAT superfamily N-acetyltransferase
MKLKVIGIVIVILSIVAIGLKYVMTKIENFQADPVYIIESTDDYVIKPFHMMPEKVKKEVVKNLQNEWADTGVTYTNKFIEDTWLYPDALYVMMTKNEEFIGCSGVDRKYMLSPFISHIYVEKKYRKHGYGEKLFDVVLRHAKKHGYKTVKGWCKDELVEYYENFGCEKCSTNWILKPVMGFNLMKKDL